MRNQFLLVSLASLALAFADGLEPDPALTVSEWADGNRILGNNSPEPGPWHTSRVPYMREIMDNLSPYSGVWQTVLMKAAQGAGTEAALNFIGHVIALGRGDILVVQPTTSTVNKFSRKRLQPMIDMSPQLRSLVSPQKSRARSNTLVLKEFAGGTILLTGANSGAGLRSDPCPNLVLDEEDGYPLDVDKEGSPGELAVQRTAAFRGRRVFRLSTPTIEGFSNIHTAFLAGDQRFYYIPCPFCGHMQHLVWQKADGSIGGIVWPAGKPDEARYQCEKCGDKFEEWQKTEPLMRGEWVPHAPGNGASKDGIVRSYQMPAMIYPYGFPGSAWTALAAQWDREHLEPIRLKTFVNLKLGLPYSDPSESRTDAAALYARREAYGPEIPSGAAVLTVGADVHPNRIEAELIAWGPGDENWSIEYRVYPGDTSRLDSSAWKAFDDWLQAQWLSEYGEILGVRAACVDSGHNTQAVTAFCGERASRRVWAVKGMAGWQRPVWSQKARVQRGKYAPPMIVGVDTAKEWVYSSLRVKEPGPAFAHFPMPRKDAAWHDMNYFEMLTSEVRLPDYSKPIPVFRWKKKSEAARNEALDVRGYGYAALQGLKQTANLNLAYELKRLVEQAEVRAARAKLASTSGAPPQPSVISTLRAMCAPIRPVDL